jgi:hypothetical protein
MEYACGLAVMLLAIGMIVAVNFVALFTMLLAMSVVARRIIRALLRSRRRWQARLDFPSVIALDSRNGRFVRR